jgi:hypothetical protein
VRRDAVWAADGAAGAVREEKKKRGKRRKRG